MEVTKNDVARVCDTGIHDFDDAMILAEYLDSPDSNKRDKTYKNAYRTAKEFVAQSLKPEHQLHCIYQEIRWRSVTIDQIDLIFKCKKIA